MDWLYVESIVISIAADKLDFFLFASTIGIAFLTILIPVAIALFDQKEYENIDKYVILDHIIRSKNILIFLVLVFVPPFFWPISPLWIRGMELISLCIGSWQMILILGRSYQWLKKDRYNIRFEYYKNIKIGEELIETWGSFWKIKVLKIAHEERFFQLFSIKIDLLIIQNENSTNATLLLYLLQDFDTSIPNRLPINIAGRQEILPKIFNWHKEIFFLENKINNNSEAEMVLDKPNLSTWSNYFQILHILDSSIRQTIKIAMANRLSFSFFKYLDAHMETVINNQNYVQYIFYLFYYEFIKEVYSSPDKNIIWSSFPPKWRITIDNLSDSRYRNYAVIAWKVYFHWSQLRIANPRMEIDEELDEISRNLFPKTDPTTLSPIIIFGISPYNPENKIQYIIEQKWPFGYMGRIKAFNRDVESGIPSMMDDNEIRETLNLARLLFPHDFTNDQIVQYIKKLKLLETEYVKDSVNESHRKRLLKIFQEMQKIYLSEGATTAQ